MKIHARLRETRIVKSLKPGFSRDRWSGATRNLYTFMDDYAAAFSVYEGEKPRSIRMVTITRICSKGNCINCKFVENIADDGGAKSRDRDVRFARMKNGPLDTRFLINAPDIQF